MGHLNFFSLVISGSGIVTRGAVLLHSSFFLAKQFTSKQTQNITSQTAKLTIKNNVTTPSKQQFDAKMSGYQNF
jgi:hypothetical protein